MKATRRFLVCIVITMVYCIPALAQTHLPPVAVNDSAVVTSSATDTIPPVDTINLTTNDYSPSGDSFCVTAVYGSSNFTLFNCNDVVFHPGSFGLDTAWYVLCNDSQPSLCDTGMVVVNVQRHYTPFMLNNSRWTTYSVNGDCVNGDAIYNIFWTYYWTTSDTLIDNMSYKTLYSKQLQGNYYCANNFAAYGVAEPYLMGYIRQDTLGHKVYFLNADSATETIIYDFNIQLADTIYKGVYDTCWTNSNGYYKSGGTYYRQVNISHYYNNIGWTMGQSELIEGFGSTLGLFNLYDLNWTLVCFSSNGITIYPDYAADTCAFQPVGIETITTIETNIHPNPTTGFCTLQLPGFDKGYSAAVLDMTGREVLPLFTNQTGSTFNFNVSSLTDGLYFVMITDAGGHVGVSKLVKN